MILRENGIYLFNFVFERNEIYRRLVSFCGLFFRMIDVGLVWIWCVRWFFLNCEDFYCLLRMVNNKLW